MGNACQPCFLSSMPSSPERLSYNFGWTNMPLRRAIIYVSLVMSLLLAAAACSRSASYYFDKGKQLAAQGKPDEAELNFRNALLKDAKLGPAYFQLSDIYIKTNRAREAYELLRQAVEQLLTSKPRSSSRTSAW
jgi:tetratricopeptide (TPR) repeat protein